MENKIENDGEKMQVEHKVGTIFKDELNRKCYIVGTLPNEKEKLIIYKYWEPARRQWNYTVKSYYSYLTQIEYGTIREVK